MVILPFYGLMPIAPRIIIFHRNRNLMMPLIDYIPGSVGEKRWKLYNFLRLP